MIDIGLSEATADDDQYYSRLDTFEYAIIADLVCPSKRRMSCSEAVPVGTFHSRFPTHLSFLMAASYKINRDEMFAIFVDT